MPDLAQRVLVEKLISWDRIRERLARYPAIASAFPLRLLEARRASAPFFCHYMAWRLGVWSSEAVFERLNQLLVLAESLPDWEHERGVLEDGDFSTFWSLMWQLQVAEHLSIVGQNAAWADGGPDLRVDVAGQKLFVECFVSRKSYGVEEFLSELLGHLGRDIKLHHDLFLPFQLPPGRDRADFLDQTLGPFLDDKFLRSGRERAQRSWPAVLARPGSSLVIYLEDTADSDLLRHDPTVLALGAGDPIAFVEVSVREAIALKATSNNLEASRPNLLAVNYLLGDMPVAIALRDVASAAVALPSALDGVAIAALGIGAPLSRDDLGLLKWRAVHSPTLEAVALPVGAAVA